MAERADDLKRVFADNTAPPEHEDLADLRELIWGVGGAAVTVIGSGTPEQRELAREILARTRRDLYRILAEDAPTPRTPRTRTTNDRRPAPARPPRARPHPDGVPAERRGA